MKAKPGIAPIETEPERDLPMSHSGAGLPLVFDAGHMAFAGGDVLRVIDRHHARINHVHTRDVRQAVIDGPDRSRDGFPDDVVNGAFAVPGDGALDFAGLVRRLASCGYDGRFVVEAERDPVANPPLQMAKAGYREPPRVVAAAGCRVA